ncbi:hypothetical protein Agub_g425, partial [Astrephomene gubernaculifera]
QQLRAPPTAAAEADSEPWRKKTRSGSSGSGSGSSSADGNGVGQDLSKIAVALARMREHDVDVWRVLARAAAATAPDMEPRALTSVLWAFGSARMTHGPLLAAAVRAIRLDMPQYTGQDLACAAWALARLAPPSAETASAAPSRSAAAAAAARELLYGDLSDAVRRRLQLQAFKPAELTTLVGAMDEMAQHQQQQQQHHQQLQDGVRHPRHLGSRPLHASPRLLRVVSQAVRKSMGALPVGVLAEAAAAFQRLGHHDLGLYRGLAAGMLLRLRHMEPRQVVRAAVALQAAGHADGVFFGKVLDTARSKLFAYSTGEVMSLVELCSRLGTSGAASASAATSSSVAAADADPAVQGDVYGNDKDSASTGTAAAASGTIADPDADSASTGVLDPAVARAFLHAAVQYATSAADGGAPNDPRNRTAANRGKNVGRGFDADDDDDEHEFV